MDCGGKERLNDPLMETKDILSPFVNVTLLAAVEQFLRKEQNKENPQELQISPPRHDVFECFSFLLVNTKVYVDKRGASLFKIRVPFPSTCNIRESNH